MGDPVRSLGREDHLEKEMATHSGTLENPMEKPGRLQSMGSQRVDMTERFHFHYVIIPLCEPAYLENNWDSG